MSRWRSWLLLGIVVAALIGSALVVLGIGAVPVPVSDVARVVARRFRLIEGADVTVLNDQIVWQMRAPRVIGSMAVGALLAMCGAVLQTLTGNDLADPYLLGISSGASVGAVFVLIVGISSTLGQSVLMTLASFIGAVVALVMVLTMATGRSGGIACRPNNLGRCGRGPVVRSSGVGDDHDLRGVECGPFSSVMDPWVLRRAEVGIDDHAGCCHRAGAGRRDGFVPHP